MLCSGLSSAQNATERIDSVDVRVYFKQGYSIIDMQYKDNKNSLGMLADKIADIRKDSLARILSVSVTGAASPEGRSSFNKKLSRRRAATAIGLINGYLPEPKTVNGKGDDWQGLTTIVEGSDYVYKNEVLHILNNVPEWIYRNGVIVDGKKRRLGMLKGGKAWRYMLAHYFPELRNATIRVVYSVKQETPKPEPPAPTEPEQPVTEPSTDLVLEDTVMVQPESEQQRRMLSFAIKTNGLYDLALVPNIGVEFFLNNGWTVGANWMYAWWNSNRRHRYWRTYGGEVEVRKYLKQTSDDIPYSGHYVGIYADALTYDFEFGGKGYMGGKPGGTLWDRINYIVGAEYGYSMPIAHRLNIDFGIGIGYMGGTYYEYEPIDDHYVWQATKQRKWFGPTKAEITLKWLIGRGNNGGKKNK